MFSFRQLKKVPQDSCENKDYTKQFFAAILALTAATGVWLFYDRKIKRPAAPGKKINIDIRYETEKDADATLLAQNLVKIVRMVLSPLESKIAKEEAALVFVFSGDSWEIRVRNGSSKLKKSIRKLLEAKEW